MVYILQFLQPLKKMFSFLDTYRWENMIVLLQSFIYSE